MLKQVEHLVNITRLKRCGSHDPAWRLSALAALLGAKKGTLLALQVDNRIVINSSAPSG